MKCYSSQCQLNDTTTRFTVFLCVSMAFMQSRYPPICCWHRVFIVSSASFELLYSFFVPIEAVFIYRRVFIHASIALDHSDSSIALIHLIQSRRVTIQLTQRSISIEHHINHIPVSNTVDFFLLRGSCKKARFDLHAVSKAIVYFSTSRHRPHRRWVHRPPTVQSIARSVVQCHRYFLTFDMRRPSSGEFIHRARTFAGRVHE